MKKQVFQPFVWCVLASYFVASYPGRSLAQPCDEGMRLLIATELKERGESEERIRNLTNNIWKEIEMACGGAITSCSNAQKITVVRETISRYFGTHGLVSPSKKSYALFALPLLLQGGLLYLINHLDLEKGLSSSLMLLTVAVTTYLSPLGSAVLQYFNNRGQRTSYRNADSLVNPLEGYFEWLAFRANGTLSPFGQMGRGTDRNAVWFEVAILSECSATCRQEGIQGLSKTAPLIAWLIIDLERAYREFPLHRENAAKYARKLLGQFLNYEDPAAPNYYETYLAKVLEEIEKERREAPHPEWFAESSLYARILLSWIGP